jgi:hypothetical protein
MSVEKSENELSEWFSTYGFITAERILGKYQIILAHDELLKAIKSPASFYHRLLQIPLKNVLTGIVLQQANDYHVYAQKLFIDYLLSGESSKEEGAQGASTRENMEEERQGLVALGEEFHQKKIDHDTLISQSQAKLIQFCKQWNVAMEASIKSVRATLAQSGISKKPSEIRQALNNGLIYANLTDAQSQSNRLLFIDKMNEILKCSFITELKDDILANLENLLDIVGGLDNTVYEFVDRTVEISQQANSYRTQFYDTILRVTELILLLPDYKIDPEQDKVNREFLYFDKSIGSL